LSQRKNVDPGCNRPTIWGESTLSVRSSMSLQKCPFRSIVLPIKICQERPQSVKRLTAILLNPFVPLNGDLQTSANHKDQSTTIEETAEKKGTQKKSSVWLQTLRVLTVLGVAVIGFHYETIQDFIPWLHLIDIRVYNWISSLEVRKPRPQWVKEWKLMMIPSSDIYTKSMTT
jgi:hypothetical protein